MNNQFDYSQPNEQPPFMPSYDMIPPTEKKSGRGFAIASLCLGIVSLFLCCCCCCGYYAAIITSILAIVFAALSKSTSGKMSGMAIAGLILGIIGILLFLFFLVMEISGIAEQIMIETLEDTYGMPYEDVLESMGLSDYYGLE